MYVSPKKLLGKESGYQEWQLFEMIPTAFNKDKNTTKTVKFKKEDKKEKIPITSSFIRIFLKNN
ncbi:MAG: hypothetical protein EBT92_12070 [Planctomycetes bacterium]|nr:hypothetical protein [Planctomycetota bacterium]